MLGVAPSVTLAAVGGRRAAGAGPGGAGLRGTIGRVVLLLGVLGVCLALFAAAVVAVREDEVLAPAERDRADLALPAGPVQAADLQRVRFAMTLRGYRMQEVDEVLDRLADELRVRDARLADLEARLAGLGPPAALPDLTDPHSGRPQEPTGPLDVGRPQEPTGPPDVGHPEEPTGPPDVDRPQEPTGPPDVADPPDLPDVEVRPGAAPPQPVPYPAPVRTDEPVQLPPAPDGAPDGEPPLGLPVAPSPSPGSARVF